MSGEILIASRLSPRAFGGIAALLRGLAAELQSRGPARVLLWSQEQDGDNPVPVPCLEAHGRSAPRALWMRLASRPMAHPLLVFLVERAYDLPRDLRPSVVHYIGTGWEFFGFAAMRFARKTGARFTVFPALHPGQWGDDAIDLRLYKAADRIICQSHHEQKHLESLGLPSGRCVVTGLPPLCRPDGIGSRFRKSLGLGHGPLVLWLGRRTPSKGLPNLREAWKSVVKKIPGAVLVAAGPNRCSSDSEEEDSIFDLEALDEQTKADALDACDVFCLPSSEESFGIVFAEAWSYGKPVLCGSAPATREWVRDGENGLWTDGSVASIESALLKLLRDPSLCRRLGTAGRQLVKSELNWDNVLAVHQRAWFGNE